MAKRGIFNDPIAPRMVKKPPNFAAPSKEEMYTDPRFQSGNNYGVGFRNPVGKEKASGASVVPLGCARYDV